MTSLMKSSIPCWTVSQRNAGLFQRFFQLKARVLGWPRLRRYDIYAPVVHPDKIYEFGQAAGMVMDSFQHFDPRFARPGTQRVRMNTIWIVKFARANVSGAFCWTVTPDRTPWVLLNYQGQPDDVATMAHELGHAIHSMLAERSYHLHPAGLACR